MEEYDIIILYNKNVKNKLHKNHILIAPQEIISASAGWWSCQLCRKRAHRRRGKSPDPEMMDEQMVI